MVASVISVTIMVGMSVAVVVVMPSQFNITVLHQKPGAKGCGCKNRLESGCCSRGRWSARAGREISPHSYVLQTGVVTTAAKRRHGVQALWFVSRATGLCAIMQQGRKLLGGQAMAAHPVSQGQGRRWCEGRGSGQGHGMVAWTVHICSAFLCICGQGKRNV
ncbi:hypothetical protein V8C86DRAFT_806646 [Haematococcus lacustris]